MTMGEAFKSHVRDNATQFSCSRPGGRLSMLLILQLFRMGDCTRAGAREGQPQA